MEEKEEKEEEEEEEERVKDKPGKQVRSFDFNLYDEMSYWWVLSHEKKSLNLSSGNITDIWKINLNYGGSHMEI